MDFDNNIKIDDIILNIVDDELAEEGKGKMISFGILLYLLAQSGIVNAAQFKSNMNHFIKGQRIENRVVSINKSDMNDIIEDSIDQKDDEMLGKWKRSQSINIIARTLFMEARGEGVDGLDMVMSVIWNRAKGNSDKLADVCLAEKQFSCWNSIDSKTPSSYQISFPKSVLNDPSSPEGKIWNYCVHVATMATDGKFTPTDSTWTHYYNPDKANPSWGSKMVGTKMVGHHKVGHIENKKGGKNVYVVKKGDTLYNIAKKDIKKVNQIKKLNGLKSDTIRPGQTLKIPV